jgi:hypothetical protein
MSWPPRRVHVADFLVAEGAEALLEAAQIEEQLALRLGGRDLHDAPVAQDELMDFGADPVDRKGHQPNSALGIEALDGLHQADIAFLNQVGLVESVAEIAARDRNHHAKVGENQGAGGVDVVAFQETPGQRSFFFLAQDREPIDRLDIAFEAAAGGDGGQGNDTVHHLLLVCQDVSTPR